MLTDGEMNDHIKFISKSLSDLKAGIGSLEICHKIDMRFTELREQYKKDPESLGDRVETLAALRQQFESWIETQTTRIIDRYSEIIDKLKNIEREKAFWRQKLIEATSRTGLAELKGEFAVVVVQSPITRQLPPKSSKERRELNEIVRLSGNWEKVSQLSNAELQRAINQNLFHQDDVDRIDRLFPEKIRHQVVVQADARESAVQQ